MAKRANRYDGDPRHARIMAAARHLNASRMGWAGRRFVSGIDFAGSHKGLIADTLIDRSLKLYKPEYQEERLAKIEAFMRVQPATNLATALRPVDVPLIRAHTDTLIYARDRWFQKHHAYEQANGSINYKFLNAAQNNERLVHLYEQAMAAVEENPAS